MEYKKEKRDGDIPMMAGRVMELFFYRKSPFAIKTKSGQYFPVKTKNGFRDVTISDIQKHLDGLHVIGAYNSMPDETPNGGTCLWGCIDFDNHKYDTIAQKIAGEKYEIEEIASPKVRVITLFEPSEMKGSHVWFFFQRPIRTIKAYEFIRGIIDDNGLTVGRNSEIDIYPKNDKLTGQKISWMVRLPKPYILANLTVGFD